MVTLHRLANDAGAFARRRGRRQAQVVHGHEYPTLRRLQPIARIGKRPADDDAHGVGQVTILELILNVERLVTVAVTKAGSVNRWIGRWQFVRQGDRKSTRMNS